MAVSNDILLGVPYNVGGTLREVDASTVVDNVFTFSSNGKKWQRVFDGGNSVYRASWLNITGAPTDKSALVAIAVANSAIQTLEIDTTIQIDSAVNFAGKTLSVKSGGLITGTYAISNSVWEGNLTQKLADTTGTITTSKSATGKWHPTWFGAIGDGVTDDYAAVNFTNTVANTNSQKIINLIPGTYNIGTNLAISSGVLLDFEHGAIIDGAVTLSGSSARFNAAVTQKVFGSSITVSGIYPANATLSPIYFGAVGDAATNDSPSIQKMFDYLYTVSTNQVEITFPARTYYHGDTVELPHDLGTSRFVKISGYGAALTISSDAPMWSRIPTNQTEALDIISSYKGTIQGFRILGNSSVASPKTLQVGFLLGAIYNWRIQDIEVQDLYTAVSVNFGLKCILDNIFGTSAWIGILGRYGTWSGSSVSNSSFNANSITNCKIFNRGGALTSLQLLGADQTQVKNFISEGQNPQYNIYYDAAGNTGVLINTFEDVWFESTGGTLSTNTNFYIRGRGMMILRRIQRIYPNILFNASFDGTSTFILEEMPWLSTLPASGIFQYTNGTGTCNISFKTIRSSDINAVFDTASWVGGSLPSSPAILYAEHLAGTEQNSLGNLSKYAPDGMIVKATGANRPSLRVNTAGSYTLAGLVKVVHQTVDGTVSTNLTSSNQFITLSASDSTTNNKHGFINSSSGAGAFPELALIRCRGTTASPTVIGADTVGQLSGYGYDGSARILGAFIRFAVEGAVSSGIVPMRVEMRVMNAAGSTVIPFVIRPTGQLEILVAPAAGTLTDGIMTITAAGLVRQIATTDLVATGAANQLAYYNAATNKVNPLTLITASRALKSDVNGLPVAFDTATEPSLTELTYVKGVTSPIQAQIGTKGLYAANGDGILTTFTVTHGYTGTPTNVQVTPAGVDSAIPLFVSNITGTTFDVTFTSAPIVGTNNVTFYWTAK